MRPDLFRAVIMGVPFLNPLAAMTNESLPLTIHEYDEWGTGPALCPPGPNFPTSSGSDRCGRRVVSCGLVLPGNPNTDEEVYNCIKSYDPYINLAQPNLRRARGYPSMLVTTSTLDNRVPFWSPAKYVAKLRALQRAEAPHSTAIPLVPAPSPLPCGGSRTSGRGLRRRGAGER
jgi:oligopeptidase B